MKVHKASVALAAAVTLGAVALTTPVAAAAEINSTLTVDGQTCTFTTQLTAEDQQELADMAEESRQEIAEYLKERLPNVAQAIDLLTGPVADENAEREARDAARTEVEAAATTAGIPEPDQAVLIGMIEYGHLLTQEFTEDAKPYDRQRDEELVTQRDELLAWDGFLSQVSADQDGADQIVFQPDTVTTVNQAYDWFQDLVDGEVALLTACIDGEPGTFTTTIGDDGDNDSLDPDLPPAEGRSSLSSGSSFGSSR